MIARALVSAAGCLAAFSILAAQDAQRFDELNDRSVQFVSLTLGDSQSFVFPDAIAPIEWNTAPAIVDVPLPVMIVRKQSHIAAVTAIEPKDMQSEPISELRKPLFDYAHGEVGVMFGMSVSDKFRGDFEAGYLSGTVGNEHLQISAGASYQRSDFRRK